MLFMKKFWIQVAILLIVIFGALYLGFNLSLIEPLLPLTQNSPQTKLMINQTVLNVEVADTAAKRSRGLGGRDSLASDSGMLFIFPETKKYQFWMKGMKFSLDFIFIKDGKVVDLLRNVPPPEQNIADENLPLYQPIVPINMMLETNAGFIDANSIKIGDTVFLVKDEYSAR